MALSGADVAKGAGEGALVVTGLLSMLSIIFGKRAKMIEEANTKLVDTLNELISAQNAKIDDQNSKIDDLSQQVRDLKDMLKTYACPNALFCPNRPEDDCVLDSLLSS